MRFYRDRMTKISARLVLAMLLALQPVVQAAELAPVDILLTRAIPQDEAALATVGPEKGERLAILQSDLALVVEGLEGFASEEDAAPSLKRLRESVDAPEQFKDRASALDAVYRALAVVDYTWAKRLPEAPCSPDVHRAALLKSGALSSWISSLLGVDADTATALDRASASTKASAREYALLRAKVRRLSEALGSEKAIGAMRASLYCRRAGAYEALSAANRSSGLVAASRAAGDDDVTGVYVLIRPSSTGWEILGAATSIDGAIVTDARLADSEGLALLRRDGNKPIPVTVERLDSGLALLRASESVKGLVLAETAPAKDDLIEALGHPERTGAWTRTRGLVTSADELSFQSDAVVDVGMAGGAALTEDGKLAGVFVLRRARSGDQAFDWPVAVSAPALKSWLAGGTLTAPAGSIEIAEAGTTSILTASRPMGESTLAGAAVWINPNVFYQDGVRAVCAANCDAPVPAPVPRARSRTRYTNPRSSYSSGSNANAELGKALGEAIAPLVEAMIFKGIPALFRGIGSLFSRKRKSTASPSRQVAVQEPVKVPEKPKEPPTLTALTLEVTPKLAAPGESVTLTATATLSDPEVSRANIVVAFKASPSTLVRFSGAQQAKTDSSGVAKISATVRRDHGVRVVKTGDSKAVKGKSDSAHSALADEARAMADESDGTSESGGATERDETIEFEASATVVKSLSASGSLILSDNTKPVCKFEPIDVPESVGTDPFSVKMRFSCTKVEGVPDVPLDGHEITLAIGGEGEPQRIVTLHTDSDGYASADFQASGIIDTLPTQPVRNVEDGQFVRAANSNAPVLAFRESTVLVPAIQFAVKAAPTIGVRAVLVISLKVTVPVVLVGGAVIVWKMRVDRKRYEKGNADLKAAHADLSEPREKSDPCEGLRDEIKEHERKLRDYTENPHAHDNLEFLGKGRDEKVIDGRKRSLLRQIANFKKLLEECEQQNEKK